MIFARIPIVRALIPKADPAHDAALRWTRAYRAEPEMAGDLIRVGGVLALRAERYVDGYPAPDPIDPVRLAYEQGQRDMAVKLLAMMSLTPLELNQLQEKLNHDRPNHRYDRHDGWRHPASNSDDAYGYGDE
ncbi:hypothetical protein [Oceaniglobus trochenteri]|uniref:hypothetical protein n=1 Tax=Oceaniglobus trochenteri TaxID=2763260 RepID=UPI001CFF5DB8|nr:hypothetical protein [Oceaniglobus trochenteri]